STIGTGPRGTSPPDAPGRPGDLAPNVIERKSHSRTSAGWYPGPGSHGTVALWDASSGDAVLSIKVMMDTVTDICFSPDGRYLASNGVNGVVTIWDAFTGQETRSLHGHSAGVRSLRFSPDGKRLATASDDRTIRIWDVVSGKEIRRLRGH